MRHFVPLTDHGSNPFFKLCYHDHYATVSLCESLSLSVHMSSSSLSLSPVQCFCYSGFGQHFFFCPDLLRFLYYVYNNYMLYMWNMIKQKLDGWVDGVVSGRAEPTNLEENNVLLRTGTLSFSFTRFTSTKKLSVCFVSSQLIWETEKDTLFIPNLIKRETDTQREWGKMTDMQTDRMRQRGEQTDSDRMITDEVTSIYMKLLHWHSQIWKPALLVTENAVAEHSPLWAAYGWGELCSSAHFSPQGSGRLLMWTVAASIQL